MPEVAFDFQHVSISAEGASSVSVVIQASAISRHHEQGAVKRPSRPQYTSIPIIMLAAWTFQSDKNPNKPLHKSKTSVCHNLALEFVLALTKFDSSMQPV